MVLVEVSCMRLCSLGGEADLVVPPWASVESYSPQLPPMATSLSRVKYHSGRGGGGSYLAHTSATLHRSVSLLWLSSSSGAHRWFGWLVQVSPDNVNHMPSYCMRKHAGLRIHNICTNALQHIHISFTCIHL